MTLRGKPDHEDYLRLLSCIDTLIGESGNGRDVESLHIDATELESISLSGIYAPHATVAALRHQGFVAILVPPVRYAGCTNNCPSERRLAMALSVHRTLWLLGFGIVMALASVCVTSHPAAADDAATIPMASRPRTGWAAWSADWQSGAPVADSGEQIWLVGDNGIARWDRRAGFVESISAVDGLPHVRVYDIVAPVDGSLWIAGDGGISVRDDAGTWAHFPAPDLLAPGRGMLMLGSGSLAWHAARNDTTVYELNVTQATWTPYSTAAAAVEARYTEIISSPHQGAFWRVSHGDVWLGFRRYDGTAWHDEAPPEPADAADMRQDAAGNLYLPTTPKVSRWDGSAWTYLEMPDNYSIGDFFMVTPAGVPWQTVVYSFTPSIIDHMITNLLDRSLNSSLGYPANTSFAMATDTTIWLIGPGWIREIPTAAPEDNLFYRVEDKGGFYAARLTAEGEIRLVGGFPTALYAPDWTLAGLEAHWPSGWQNLETIRLLQAWEYSPDGALWSVAEYQDAPPYRTYPLPPRRKTDDRLTQWSAWPVESVSQLWQMTISSAREVIFGVSAGDFSDTAILVLETGATPTETGDDRWTVLPLPTAWYPHDLVRDARGSLWAHISRLGLARYEDDRWVVKFAPETAPWGTTLVPAADGTLYVVRPESDEVLVIHPDGSGSEVEISDLATDDLGRLLTVTRRNTRLAVGDNTLWFTRSTGNGRELVQRRIDGWLIYPLPPDTPLAGDLVVDRDGVVWLAAGATIWRYGDLPSFGLSAQPAHLLATPGQVISGRIALQPLAQFRDTAVLAAGAPSDLEFDLDAEAIDGETPVGFTMTAPALPGIYLVEVTAHTAHLEAHSTIAVTVVETRDDLFLPYVARR